jgi:NADH-quinone oxidoreductase subunit N
VKVILLLSGLGLLALFAELFRFKKVLYPLMLIGILGAIALAVSYWWLDDGSMAQYFNGMVKPNHQIPSADEMQALRTNPNLHGFASMLIFDRSSIFLSVILLSTTFLWLILSKDFFQSETSRTDHYALILFALTGAIILTCYSNLAMLFLGIEILSIPLYVLAGSRKDDLASNEASFKYFLMGAFASGFLLFGITLVYGAAGSFDMKTIGEFISINSEHLPSFLYAGIIMMLVGLLFKVSAAPFHFWAPDVYQGSPTHVTAFMSTVVKTAAIAAIMRLFLTAAFGGASDFWIPVVGVCCGLTLVVGNITAAVQDNVKRMFAYSSISHAGFLLLAIVGYTTFSSRVIIYYTAAYSIASIAAFTVLVNVMKYMGNDKVESFNGLGKKNPLLAVAMTIALLSLAGIPPTAGFFAKYYVFNAALAGAQNHPWLVVIAILSSLVGVYYYFRIIIAMYFKPAVNENPVTADNMHQALLFITAVLILVLGLLPDLILNIGTYTQVTP